MKQSAAVTRDRATLVALRERIAELDDDMRKRDRLVVKLARKGVPKVELAADAGISAGRVSQLLKATYVDDIVSPQELMKHVREQSV